MYGPMVVQQEVTDDRQDLYKLVGWKVVDKKETWILVGK